MAVRRRRRLTPLAPHLLRQARPRRAQDADGVGLVGHEHGAREPGRGRQVGQRRPPAVHREDRVGDQEPTAGAVGLVGEYLRSGRRVALGIAGERGPGEGGRVVQAGVTRPVHHHGVAAARKGRQDPQVRHVAGGEDQGGLRAHEAGEVGLQGGMGIGVAGQEPAGARAPAPAVEAAAKGVGDARVCRQTQVVVRGEEEDFPAGERDARSGVARGSACGFAAAEGRQGPVQALGLQVGERRAGGVGGHGYMPPPAMKMVSPVMKPSVSPASQTTQRAMSWAWPSLPTGIDSQNR